jgi:DNA-binding PadR family transcriptional regulator
MPDNRTLTDNEGAVMSLVRREQPITGYQIAKSFDDSPVHTFNTSKGKLYPLLRRLVGRKFLSSESVPHDSRGTQRFLCTEEGCEALKEWVLTIRPEHHLLHDPLRKKVQDFELLSPAEQAQWLSTAKEQLKRKLRAVESWSADGGGPYGNLVIDSAKSALEARIAWLDRATRQISP